MLTAQRSYNDPRSTTPTPSDPYGLRSYALPLGSASTPALTRSAEPTGLGIAELENTDAPGGEVGHGGKEEGLSSRNRKDSGGTRVLSKLFSSWGRSSDKKNASTSPVARAEPSFIVASPSPPLPSTSTSLPLGFPAPPPMTRPADSQPYPPPRAPFHYVPPPQSRPQPHASASIAPHIPQRVIKTSHSNSTVSTSCSSFASTSAFTDEWDSSSEATSLSMTSSPDSSPRRHGRKSSKSSNGPQRMWRVKGLTEPQIEEKDETEVITRSRNSTPIPSSFVEAMFAEPSTPPRLKRLSASSTKPSPSSPPFNLAHEKAVRPRSKSVQGSPTSPGSCGDADDEDSPRARRKEGEGGLLGSMDAFSARMRIPSIRFEGISMDEVFAEVEKKMKDEVASGSSSVEKRAKRRTRVFSMYRPMSSFAENVAVGSASSISSTASSRDPLSTHSSLDSIASTSSQPLDTPRPRPPNPRRPSLRPSPLNVAAANSIIIQEPRPSSVTPTAATAAAARAANAWSPPLAGAFSPTRPTRDIFSPGLEASFSAFPSLGLGEAFVQSPVSSSRSTMCGVDLPEVCIFPPSPTRRGSDDTISGVTTTRVVLHEPKRTVKTSSRASTVPRKVIERRTYVTAQEIATPPLSPALSTFSSSGTASPVFLDALPSPTFDKSSDSEAEDALSNLLAKLNAPRTPPSSSLPRVPTSSPVYDSDDSATRFGDAPLTIKIPLGIPTIVCSEGPWEDSTEELKTPRGTTPTFVLTPSSSTDSTNSLVSLAGTEESETESEVAVVMMGERISCGYDIGVAM